MCRKLLLLLLAMLSLLLFVNSMSAQTPINGYWEGVIADSGRELRFNVEFSGTPGEVKGRIDIPDLYVFDYSLANIKYEFPKVHFELPLARQPDLFDGALTNENISGKYAGRFYKEQPRDAVFHLWREKRDVRYTREDVVFPSGNIKLAGTLFLPLKKGPHPAVVFLHGSGPQTRESYLKHFADLFARRGFAALIYDKRGTGASTGEIWYRTGDNFDNLVADALAGVKYLAQRADINRRHVGLWGLSQGGWLAPMAAERSNDVAFLITISGGGVTPAQQELYDDEVNLRDRGFPEDQITEAVNLLKMADNVIRKKVAWEEFAAAREKAQPQPWFALLDRFPVKLPAEDSMWQSGSEQMDFDPAPVWQKIHIPVLAIFGESDKSTPSIESAKQIEVALKKGRNRHYRIEIIPHADHALWITAEKNHWDWDRPARGWQELLTSFLQRQQ